MDVIGQNFDNGRFEINEMNFTHEDILYDPNQQFEIKFIKLYIILTYINLLFY